MKHLLENDKPARIAALPTDARGFPIPHFATWKNGKPNFQVADEQKRVECAKTGRCWICGKPNNGVYAFVGGPLSTANRIFSDAPAHVECAMYAAKVCPFLAMPNYRRVATDGQAMIAMVEHNPAVCCVFVTRRYGLVKALGDMLFAADVPLELHWFREGRAATRAELSNALDASLPYATAPEVRVRLIRLLETIK